MLAHIAEDVGVAAVDDRGIVAGEGDMSWDIELLLRWASLLLTLPVVLYSAAPFFQRAWRDVRLRRWRHRAKSHLLLMGLAHHKFGGKIERLHHLGSEFDCIEHVLQVLDDIPIDVEEFIVSIMEGMLDQQQSVPSPEDLA